MDVLLLAAQDNDGRPGTLSVQSTSELVHLGNLGWGPEHGKLTDVPLLCFH